MTSRFMEEFLAIQFFGEFLIDRWMISREQLLEALEYQMQRNAKFGAIAIKKGFLTEEQVERVHGRQRQTDMSFGELAVSMGLLDDRQAREIISYQQNNNIYLGEVLLRLGFIDEESLRRELAFFREHQHRYAPHDPRIPEGVVDDEGVMRAGVDLTRKMFSRVVNLKIKVGGGAVIQATDERVHSGYYASVAVRLTGRSSIEYVLSVDRTIATRIASAILMEDASGEAEALIVDAVKEFCNIVCGNAAGRLAQDGIEMEIAPPERLESLPMAADDRLTVAFPVRAVEGGIDLRFRLPPASVTTKET